MSIRVERLQDHSFVASALSPNSLVIDLGANAGRFAELIAERYGSRCICFEPNPVMFQLISASSRIAKHQLAAGGRYETVQLYVDDNPEASSVKFDAQRPNRIAISVEAVPFGRILDIAAAERIDLLKVDIEGSETDLFAHALDSDLKRVNQLSVEFHEMHGWTDKRDIASFVNRMQRLGFSCVRMSALHYGDVLFLNRDHFETAQVEKMVSAAKRFRSRRILNSVWHRGIGWMRRAGPQ